MKDKARIQSFRVANQVLPEATAAINGHWDCFEARVQSIIILDGTSIINVEMRGSYPYIENEWEKWFITS